MISYFIEFSILHLLFYGIYKLLLAKETQLRFLRFFLVGSTALSLIIPAIEIPSKSPIPLNMDAILLPVVSKSPEATPMNISWYLIAISIVSVFLLIKFIINLYQIYGWYKKSETASLDQIPIRKVTGLQNSFTFFNWIFIDPGHFENPADIIRHELGHARKLHSLDLLFFFILSIFSWWLPSIWLMIKELKAIHEYEADEFALGLSDQTYAKTLVQCTLQAHGVNLASSFDDAPIFNRLNFMKKMKKKISTWKVASIATVVAISGALFACEEELNNESQEIEKEVVQVDSSVDATQSSDLSGEEIVEIIEEVPNDEIFTLVENSAQFPGGVSAFGQYLSENISYPKQAQRLGVQGKVFVEFIVEKDGSLSNMQVIKGIGGGCDEEALRIMRNSPKWKPGSQRGHLIRQKMLQPITFALSE